MTKSMFFAVLTIVILAMGISAVSASSYYSYSPISYTNGNYADSYTNYGTAYSYKAPESYSVYPSYTYTPTITNNVASQRENSAGYSNTYQGPVIERTSYYDESLDVKRSNKFTRTVSARTTEKYIGAFESTSASSSNKDLYSSSYKLSSPNPTSYNGGSYWSYAPKYDYKQYGGNSYTSEYYYAPKMSNGHYDWGY